jgi:hypothetical protein
MRTINNLTDVQIVLKELCTWKDNQISKAKDQRGLQIKNAGDATDPADLVTLSQLKAASSVTNTVSPSPDTSLVTANKVIISQQVSGSVQPTLEIDIPGVLAKTRITRTTASVPRADILCNVFYDGVNWNLDDITLPGLHVGFNTQIGIIFHMFTAGANPRTTFTEFTVDPSGNVIAAGDISAAHMNASAGFSANGVPGVTIALHDIVVLAVPGYSTIQYKDWSGTNQSMNVVTSVTLTMEAEAYTEGIRTT